ncbi:MAG: type I-C CRISPR-associated protein Cas5c [Candidatus Brocadiaceae bacterium]|nr:type I-C CRISPR-associated protein Cas5c [Candidatus Brocadiaceae bacterium]
MRGKTHCLEVWGDFACFTRPEMKVERFSYPVITPSAARGVFDAIYWKRSYGFYWQIEKIDILLMPRYIALRRNEVKDKAPSERTILSWKSGKSEIEPLWADGDRDLLGTDQKGRTQRQTMALKDVRYRLYAHISFRGNEQDIKTHDSQFERRASHGKCFYQPYFGCREFPVYFELIENVSNRQQSITLDLDLGWMLYDVFDLGHANDEYAPSRISVFHARISKGEMKVPAYNDPAVRKVEEVPRA